MRIEIFLARKELIKRKGRQKTLTLLSFGGPRSKALG